MLITTQAYKIITQKKHFFLAQGQWVVSDFLNNRTGTSVVKNTIILPWPKLPGEKKNMNGSIATMTQPGYGLTKKGEADPFIRDTVIKFIKYYNSSEEITRRLKRNMVVAPILKNYKVPEDFPHIIKQKVTVAYAASFTEIIDAFLEETANEALNKGIIKIISNKSSPGEIAREVDNFIQNTVTQFIDYYSILIFKY